MKQPLGPLTLAFWACHTDVPTLGGLQRLLRQTDVLDVQTAYYQTYPQDRGLLLDPHALYDEVALSVDIDTESLGTDWPLPGVPVNEDGDPAA